MARGCGPRPPERRREREREREWERVCERVDGGEFSRGEKLSLTFLLILSRIY
jgi:hypothetical protein